MTPNIEKTENKIVNKNPSHEQVLRDIKIILDLMSTGYTEPLEIKQALINKNINWSRNKIQSYIKMANLWIAEVAQTTKTVVDQRHILVKKSEAVERSAWEDIVKIEEVRVQALNKIKAGTSIDQLDWEEQQILSTDIDKLINTKQKAYSIILKAQERQSELFGYKNDKRILIEHDSGYKLKYEDDINKELLKKYRSVENLEDNIIIDAEFSEDNIEELDDIINTTSELGLDENDE